jgi:3'-phosphoadenosine 5'-phosphosulfate sulfotransferase (PAPS reductase)/FAD synthetase
VNIQIPLFDSRKDHRIDFDQSAPIVVNVSGGKDSSALLLWIKAHYSNPITAIYHDTGFEHPGVEEYIRQMTGQLGIPLVVTQPTTDLLSLVLHYGRIPGFGCRYCTRALKMDPGNKWIRNTYPEGKVIQCFGFRAEESPSRAKKEVLTPYDDLCTQKREVWNFAPLLDWKTADVVELVEAEGFDLFPTYEYLSRLSCRYCFLAGKRDQDAVRMNDPEGYEQVLQVLNSIESTVPANKVLQRDPTRAEQVSLFN